VIATPNESSTGSQTKETYAALIEEFGKGWEAGSGERISEIFSEEGVFLPTPTDSPVAYWDDIPREQAEISFRFGEIFVAGPWFSTEFRCTFRRRRTGEWMDVRGAFFCETADGKIEEMRMYWHRTTGTQES
jgi:ketosteroid isomerase-like protein